MTNEVLVRLNRIEGHVRGIHEMVKADRSCADVLLQLGAVRAAVAEVARIVLEDHLEHCIADDDAAALNEFKIALGRYLKNA